MANLNKKSLETKELLLLIIAIFLIIINLILVLKLFIKPKENNNNAENLVANTENVVTNKISNNSAQSDNSKTKDDIKTYLSSLNERDRIEYYCGEYFNYLNKDNYEAAYKLLYEEFKEKYFPTLDEYKKYVKEFYPDFYALDYNDFSRQGDIYVLRLKILDLSKSENEQGDNVQRIVIKENGYNDFVLSFQVK